MRTAALPDDVDLEAEMAAAFGWDVPPTDEQMEADHVARMCEGEELLARFPGLLKRPDAYLIKQIADPLGFTDAADVTRACCVILERRLARVPRRRPRPARKTTLQ